MTSVAVIGGGSWGTALALCAHRAGNPTHLWMRSEEAVRHVREKRENKRLPTIEIPQDLYVTDSFEEALRANIVILATPAQTLRSVLEEIKKHDLKESYFIIASKGIEMETGNLMHEVAREILPHQPISVLSGPTFAREVGLGLPTAATLASEEISTARWLASSLSSPAFRLYPSRDLIGVETAGALKNVLAIASGICTARRLGESARASLMTRGIAEITRLGIALGADAETFLGLSGVGDIILSCTSPQSRNMSLGLRIGNQAIVTKESLFEGGILTEGYFTACAVMKRAKSLSVELPICAAVNNVLHHQSPIEVEIEALLARPLKTEQLAS